nr:baculoviral IAP repeat-containing protein 5 [Aotus nancymaae]
MGAPALPPAWQPFLKDHRISTFKNWPFLEGSMRSGLPLSFLQLPFRCCSDFSREEHKKHSSGCAFLSVKKQFEELTLGEFLKLDRERAKNKIAKETNNKKKEFEETAKKVRRAIEQLAAME